MYGRRSYKLLLMGGGKYRASTKVALGGIIAALMAAAMLASYFPYLTYAVPAVAGLFIIVPMVELSAAYAFLSYISASAVVLITAESEAKLLFVLFFGYYPIIKALLERLNKRWLEYLLKFLVFNIAVVADVAASVFILGIPVSEFVSSPIGVATAPVLLLMGNIVFAIYDMGATRIISSYVMMLHPKIKKMLK